MFGVALILVIVITGGLIAFIGDRIGTRVGKRRMTLWGLRPRYTSIIITILTGILIAGSTMGLLTVISYDVRTALFGMEALKKQTKELAVEVDQRTNELAAARAEIDKKNAEFAAASQQISSISQEIHSLQQNKQALDARIASLSDARAELQKDIDRLNELTANLRKGITTVREGTIVLRAGEVLSVNVIQGGGTAAEVEARLSAYMKEANQRLRDRFQIQDPQLDLIFIPRLHAEEVLGFLAARPEAIVLRLLSAGNVVVGEPVIGQFEAFPNRLVFDQGATVLSDKVEFSGDSKEAEQILTIFLRRVNEMAVQKGIIPDPLQGTVGAVSMEQYFETLNQLRRLKGSVEITAIATEPVFSAGPLRITIQVRSAAGSPMSPAL
jgi:uncharacterized protein (DUF3084 family)